MTTLYHAALLAGLGSHALAASEEPGSRVDSGASRTCVDAGGRLMLALDAPGGRSLHTVRRVDDGRVPGVCQWRAERHEANGGTGVRTIATFPGDAVAAWRHATEVAASIDGLERLRLAHAALGPHARIFSVEQAAETHETWVTWQLDRHADLRAMLAACGAPGGWEAVAEALATLTGRAPSRTGGPWSIARTLHADGPLRVGTTLWARLPEGQVKRRAFASLVESLGGDGRFAEGLYRLLEQAAEANGGSRIGRAVELTLDGARISAAHWLLSVPS